jgi:hypothetical protein
VYLSFADSTICKLHGCYTLHLSPTALAVSALQIAPDVHAPACCDCLNVSNFVEDLKFHHHSTALASAGLCRSRSTVFSIIVHLLVATIRPTDRVLSIVPQDEKMAVKVKPETKVKKESVFESLAG